VHPRGLPQLGKKLQLLTEQLQFFFLFFVVSNCSFFTLKNVKKLQLLTYFFWPRKKQLSLETDFRLVFLNFIVRLKTKAVGLKKKTLNSFV